MNKLAYYLSMFVLFCAIVFGAVITYWCVYPYKPLEFKDEVFPVGKTVYKSGEVLTYTSNYCKYMDLPALVTRTFVNEILFVTPSTITNRPIGCNSLIISVAVPKELPTGNYWIEMTYQHQVNPIRKITIKEKTEEFRVVN